jgi:hypothetical protein
MYFVFKEDGRCDAWGEALFLAGVKREGYKDIRLTAIMLLFFGEACSHGLLSAGSPF